MFATKIGGSYGVNIALGGPGFEKSLIVEQVIQDAKARGVSFKKTYNRLGNNVELGPAQVVSSY